MQQLIIEAISIISTKERKKDSSFMDLVVPSVLEKSVVNEILSRLKEINLRLRLVFDDTIQDGFKIIYDDLIVDASIESNANELESFLNKRLENSTKEDFIENLKKAIEEYRVQYSVSEVGTVINVKDGICMINGLKDCMYQEILLINKQYPAIAMNIEKYQIGAVLLDKNADIIIGDIVERTKQVASIGVSEEILGRVVDALGNPIDGKSIIKIDKYMPIEKVAPDVISRKPVDKPLLTGITAIDALIPIGRGQRELILGDRQTGKTSICIDTIINQKDKDIICVYASIGQKQSKIARIVETLKDAGAMEYTIVITSSASDSAAKQFITPYSATAIAEYFLEKGKDVLVVYDDLTKHAIAYRELSLLLRRPPGREAYPGDVFYLHSRLLERSCCLSEENGGGSITSLPIIETQAGDITSYIPTNVISITDGQIFLETDLFYKGIRPAINIGLSVSRVGSAAQTKPMKKVAGKLKVSLAQYRELEVFSQFSGEVDTKTKEILLRGQKTIELLKQKNLSPRSNVFSIVAIFVINKGIVDDVGLEYVNKFVEELFEYIGNEHTNLLEELENNHWDEEIEEALYKVCIDFKRVNHNGISETN